MRMSAERARWLRFIANGLLATIVHFGVLSLCVEVLRVPSAGISNMIAATFGITSSFLGNRHLVLDANDRPALPQVGRFVLLYARLALLQGVFMMAWADWGGFDYRIGFVLATAFQLVFSYLGNQHLVFRQ